MATNILTHNLPPSNTPADLMTKAFVTAFVTPHHRPTITAAVDLRTESELVIPKGTPGRILEINRHGLAFLDFGAFPVYAVPVGSNLVKWSDLTAGGAK